MVFVRVWLEPTHASDASPLVAVSHPQYVPIDAGTYPSNYPVYWVDESFVTFVQPDFAGAPPVQRLKEGWTPSPGPASAQTAYQMISMMLQHGTDVARWPPDALAVKAQFDQAGVVPPKPAVVPQAPADAPAAKPPPPVAPAAKPSSSEPTKAANASSTDVLPKPFPF